MEASLWGRLESATIFFLGAQIGICMTKNFNELSTLPIQLSETAKRGARSQVGSGAIHPETPFTRRLLSTEILIGVRLQGFYAGEKCIPGPIWSYKNPKRPITRLEDPPMVSQSLIMVKFDSTPYLAL
jgi:hypothetical protein